MLSYIEIIKMLKDFIHINGISESKIFNYFVILPRGESLYAFP